MCTWSVWQLIRVEFNISTLTAITHLSYRVRLCLPTNSIGSHTLLKCKWYFIFTMNQVPFIQFPGASLYAECQRLAFVQSDYAEAQFLSMEGKWRPTMKVRKCCESVASEIIFLSLSEGPWWSCSHSAAHPGTCVTWHQNNGNLEICSCRDVIWSGHFSCQALLLIYICGVFLVLPRGLWPIVFRPC